MKLRSVSRSHPCPVCGGNHKCSFNDDGLILCGRMTGDVDGYKCFGVSRKDSQWSVYRAKTERRTQPVIRPKTKQKDDTDWTAVAKRYAFPAGANSLDVALNLPAGSTGRLPLVGFNTEDVGGPCWTVPMVNGAERIVGISRRYRDGSKKSMGSNGLFVPAGWLDVPGPVFVVEGASDTAAMAAAGLCAVGRFSSTGGAEMLFALLQSVTPDREIIVVGERDEKDTGLWPGLDGAMDVATKLWGAFQRRRAVKWAVVPAGAKDVRNWLTQWSDPWPVRGECLREALERDAVFAGEERTTMGRMVVEMRDAISRMNDAIELYTKHGEM
jgi:hypothetical protein